MAGRPQINDIDFDKIYHSNTYGDFKIIENCGRNECSRLYVKIKFLNTESEKIVRYDTAMAGKVRDELADIDFNKIYISNYYGPFKIISYLGRICPNDQSRKMVRIKFLNTGYECDVRLRTALEGNVKDSSISYKDKYIFYEPFSDEYNIIIESLLRNRWKGMMSRCYNKKDANYCTYGAIGVKVDEYWHNFDNYISSLPLLPGYIDFYNDPSNYHLDKDYLQFDKDPSERIYSPTTCLFLSMYDNDNLLMIDNEADNSFHYYGVRETKSGYLVSFSIDGIKYNFGKYSDFIVALNEYNYYYNKYSKAQVVPLLNLNIPYISHEDAQKYLVSKSTANIE